MSLASFALSFAVLLSGVNGQSRAPVNGCTPDCEAMVANGHWVWWPVSITSSMVHATVLYVTNDEDGSVRTTTIFNDLPSGMTPPSTNAAGTHTAQVTMETAKNEFSTFDLAYPTELRMQDVAYTWGGTVPTTDAFGQPTCSTNTKGATVDLVDYTAPIATITTDTANPTDKAGIFYTLWNYHCQEGPLLATPPVGNLNDGAIQYCNTTQAVCGAVALSSVQFLTETGTSHEKKPIKVPSTSATTTTTSDPPKTSKTTTTSIEAAPAVVPPSKAASKPPATTTTRQATAEAETTQKGTQAPPKQTGKTPKLPAQEQDTKQSTVVVVETTGETEERQTQVLTLGVEVTGPEPTTTKTVQAVTLVITEQITVTQDGAVYVVDTDATASAQESEAATTEPIGDAIAGGLGFTGSDASPGSSSTTGASQFPGSASSFKVPSWIFAMLSANIVYISLT